MPNTLWGLPLPVLVELAVILAEVLKLPIVLLLIVVVPATAALFIP